MPTGHDQTGTGGKPPERTWVHSKPEEKQRVLALKAAGYGPTTIADKTGLPYDTVRSIIRASTTKRQ